MISRPFGFTVLALLLGWLSLAGLGFAWASPFLRNVGETRWLLAGFGVLYFTCALTAAISLWRMRPWAGQAVFAWVVASALGALLPYVVTPEPWPWWAPVLSVGLAAGVLWFPWRYVTRRLTSAA